MKFLDKVLRAGDGKRVKAVKSVVAPINSLEPHFESLSDSELQAKTPEFKERLEKGESLDNLMPEAFATVREAARRVVGQRHYDVQLMGGAALHWGSVAEMKTGEGKTLVSTLPVYLNALSGNGVHVVTVNDYLASRDSEWMGQIHGWLGLSMGLVVPGNATAEHKRQQYAADITYGTNNEFGFDYLRDNMASSIDNMTQRGHAYAVIDEIDSILIDEARTPLIISGKVRGAADLYYQFADAVRDLERDEDYDVDEEKRIVAITEDGVAKIEKKFEVDNLYDGAQSDLVHQLNVALKAKELFQLDKDYLVADGQVKIVDEFTGRVLDGRRWSDGLHQAVEAKEGVKIKEEQQTLATVTLQNYFRMYDKLAGMTGTALADAAELETTYSLAVVQIPTNKPIQRVDETDLVYKSEDAKFSAVVDDLEERIEAGQPVLVGTASVEKSEKLAKLLKLRGISHEVLNAKANFREADIVAQAGKPGIVTVATNMAGRGVDIILGGNPEKLAESDTKGAGLELESEEGQEYFEERFRYWDPICEKEGERVRESGGLYVLATERHESRRIDDQLRGRSGRQGDPGESRFYLSLEDDLMRVFATGAMDWVMGRALPDDVPIESKAVTKSVERAQNTVEQRNAETRKNVLKYDEVYNQQRKVIYERRQQILEQGDLREDSIAGIAEVAASLVDVHCAGLDDEWDFDGLETELKTFWETELTAESFDQKGTEEIQDLIEAEGLRIYEEREETITPTVLRQIERQVMLQLVDRRWRDHLADMQSLREGIGLRAIGQRDPLTEWQREGFDLFSEMIHSLSLDYVRYVMQVQVVQRPTEEPQDAVADDSAAAKRAEPVDQSAADKPAVKASKKDATSPMTTNITAQKAEASTDSDDSKDDGPKTVVKDEWSKTPRNAPCPCGNGKKFKACCGRK